MDRESCEAAWGYRFCQILKLDEVGLQYCQPGKQVRMKNPLGFLVTDRLINDMLDFRGVRQDVGQSLH